MKKGFISVDDGEWLREGKIVVIEQHSSARALIKEIGDGPFFLYTRKAHRLACMKGIGCVREGPIMTSPEDSERIWYWSDDDLENYR